MKKIFCLIMALCMVLVASSCNLVVKNSDDSRFDYPVTVGNIVFNKAPENVVVLSENIADIILACDYEGKLAARSDICGQKELELLPSVGTPTSPDTRMIKDLNSTLVITDEAPDNESAKTLSDLGISVLIIKPAANDADLKALYANIASILGGSYSGKMKALSTEEEISSQLDSIKNEIIDKEVLATACYIYSVENNVCRVACGRDCIVRLFDYAQITNIAAEAEYNDGYMDFNTLLKGNPETIFCDKDAAEALKSNDTLKKLSAVQNSRVYVLPQRYLSLQGVTQITTTDYLAAKTHDYYTPKTEWPDDFSPADAPSEITQDYIPPFEPQENIFYTVGENYSQIKFVEERLIQLGYLDGEADTSFNQETADAVSRFQEKNEIEITGIANYDTLVVLLSNYAKPAN